MLVGLHSRPGRARNGGTMKNKTKIKAGAFKLGLTNN